MRKVAKSLLSVLALLAVWQIGSMMTTPLFVPSPASVVEALIGLVDTGQLLPGMAYSFARITVAAFLSMTVAVPLALIVSAFRTVSDVVSPIVSAMRYIPVTAFSPLLILWFGIDETMKLSFLFLATFVYLLPSTVMCLGDVPQDLIDTGRSIGMKTHEIIMEILLPAALPSIANSFLMMYGIGWTYVAVIEAVNAKKGLGFIINVGAARGRTAIVFAAILVIVLFSSIFDMLGKKLIRRVFRWRYLDDNLE